MFDEINSIFLDFDGTITKFDTVCTFFKTFAPSKWLDVEKDWIKGKINSKTCMQMQLNLIKNLTEEQFYNYLNSIELQDGFKDFCTIMQKHNKNIYIISDGFDFFIDYTLRKENLNIPFFTNKLKIEKENNYLKFNLFFDNEDKNCTLHLGCCKCKIAKMHTIENEKFIFAGDGLSDRCIASKANLLFAKNSLKAHCIENNMNFVEFNDFNDILNHLFLKKGMKNAGFRTKNAHRSADKRTWW